MKLKDFSLLLLLFFTANTFAQFTINGVVLGADGKKVAAVAVYNKTSATKTSTNSNGEFSFEVDENKNYELVFYKENYGIVEKTVTTSDSNLQIVLEKITALSEVVINKQRDKVFALNKLRDIEETAIYAGKNRSNSGK
jgi:Fe(3+) dicitrate transport protein